LIVRWPGEVPAGVTEDAVVTSVDLFPTILALAGAAPAAPDPNLDGVSLVALLTRQGQFAPGPVYWHYPHYHPGGATPGGAIRDSDHKLIEFFEDDHVELYNLKDDLSETKDLAAEKPEMAAGLRKKLADWRRKVNARMPTPNPDYDPTKPPKWAARDTQRRLADAGVLFEE
jgi:arylsulfatase A-like enzyme